MNQVSTMTKAEYAAHRGVNATRISQYIKEGKIGPNALVGVGVRAKINIELADKQLAERLDASQSFGHNGKAAERVLTAPEVPSQPDMESPDWGGQTSDQSALKRVAEERARQEELRTAKMEREEAQSIGRYMLTSEARGLAGRAATEAFTVMDRAARDMANAVAAEFSVDKALAATVINKVWRATREKAAAQYEADAQADDEFVQDTPREDSE